MGRVLLIGRLGARDLRHRPVQAVLPPRLAGGPPGDRARLQALACAPGVTGRSGTVSGRRRRAAGTGPHGGGDGRRARPGGPAPAGQPKVLAGS